MNERWRGLHNPDRHRLIMPSVSVAVQCSCGNLCDERYPCQCCLAAEVEALRAQVQRVREVTVAVPDDAYDLDSYTRGASDALALIHAALDGGE
jgi:hypothetical protein